MRSGHLKAVRTVVLLLACLMALEFPVVAQRGRGHGRGHGRSGIVLVRATPGIPTSQRGRGRNWHPRTRRGRYVRTIIRRNNRNWHPGIARRRRVRRHGMH